MKCYPHKTYCLFILLVTVFFVFAANVAGQGISEEARRYMMRGIAAIEMAKTQADYILAAQEFEKAAKLAPDYPDIYYNLGNVQSKMGDFSSAMKSFQRYLELAPRSPEAAKVRDEIYKLEFRRDQQKLVSTLTGNWYSPREHLFKLGVDGSRIQLQCDRQGDDVLTINSMGTHVGPMNDIPLLFLGVIIGENRISGQYVLPAGKYSGYCDVPERKGNFEGTIDAAAGLIRIVYDRVVFDYEMEFASFFSTQLVCRQTGQKKQTGHVLEIRRQPVK
ncbi:MAG: tetratricopeptide repeat protein [Syntrophorhabdaceae bacterium]